MTLYAYEGFMSRAAWAVALHPFDLVATRMITEPGPEYATALTTAKAAIAVSPKHTKCNATGRCVQKKGCRC